MISSTIRAARTALVILVVGALVACDTQGPGVPPPVSASPSPSASASPTPGISAEEDLSINPPAPTAVRAESVDGAVRLSWQPPPEVTVPHRYSDRVTGYRIYRRGPGETELRPVGTSAELGFTDRAPGSGEFAYAVTSIREEGVEGTKSDPPAVVQIS